MYIFYVTWHPKIVQHCRTQPTTQTGHCCTLMAPSLLDGGENVAILWAWDYNTTSHSTKAPVFSIFETPQSSSQGLFVGGYYAWKEKGEKVCLIYAFIRVRYALTILKKKEKSKKKKFQTQERLLCRRLSIRCRRHRCRHSKDWIRRRTREQMLTLFFNRQTGGEIWYSTYGTRYSTEVDHA